MRERQQGFQVSRSGRNALGQCWWYMGRRDLSPSIHTKLVQRLNTAIGLLMHTQGQKESAQVSEVSW